MLDFSLSSFHLQFLEILAFAVMDLFPTAKLCTGKASNIDFYYDFIFETPLTDQSITLIEEHYRKALKEFSGFEEREMMRENAAAFFEHKNQFFKAEQALQAESNTIEILKCDDFYDLKPIGFKRQAFDRVYSKIFSFFTYDHEGIKKTRIEAGVFFDQASLKEYQKLRKKKSSETHQIIGQKLHLFDCEHGEWVFYPRGEQLKQLIKKVIEEECLIRGFPLVSAEEFTLSSYPDFSRFGIHGISKWDKSLSQNADPTRGLIEASSYHSLRVYESEESKTNLERCISSLQFIQKIIKIFDLNHEWVLRCYRPKTVPKKKWQAQVDLLKSAVDQCDIRCCLDYNLDDYQEGDSYLGNSYPKVELSVYDSLLRKWAVAAVNLASCDGKEILIISPLVSMERFIALFLEQNAGDIPRWLQPEQVRVLSVAKENVEAAKNLRQLLQNRGIRTGLDIGSEKLTEKVGLCVQHKVPYVIVLGNEEEKSGLVAVRRYGEEKTTNVNLEEFILIVKQELKRKLES